MTSFPDRAPPPHSAPHLAPADVTDAQRALRDAGGASLSTHDGVTVGGWEVRTSRTPILGKEALAGLEARLGTSHLPEMLYGSALTLTHAESNTKLHFNAEDALREWLVENAPPLKIAAAARWAEAHRLRFGTGAPPNTNSGSSGSAPPPGWDETQPISDYDWTVTTPYRGSVMRGGEAAGEEASSSEDCSNRKTNTQKKSWMSTQKRVDRGALMAREPILFFDELTLYESELDDNGESSVTIKVRVMPTCWFVLMRFWMRCDGVRVRLRETRFFCKIDKNKTPVVIRESARRDESFVDLKKRGAPGNAAAYPNADEAASVLLAAGGPVEMEFHELGDGL